MELGQYPEEWPIETLSTLLNHSNLTTFDATIEPWLIGSSIKNKAPSVHKNETKKPLQRWYSQRKKTIDEKIQEVYHKYNREHINQQINRRQTYREMLKDFEKANQFKQIGLKRQNLAQDFGNETFSQQIINQKNNPNISVYEYQQASTSPKRKISEEKCINKFQRMMKIRDKVRKKNTIAVAQLKEKYLNQYNLAWPYAHKQAQVQANTQTEREKIPIKIRIRSQLKSKNTFDQPSQPKTQKKDFKVIGYYSNALETAIRRGLKNYSCNGMRGSKHLSNQLTQTTFPFRH